MSNLKDLYNFLTKVEIIFYNIKFIIYRGA